MTKTTFKLKPLQRRTVCEPMYSEKLGKHIEFSIAVAEDYDIILDYCVEVAYPLKALDVAANLTAEQFREYNVGYVKEWLRTPFTILAHCDLDIYGLVSGIIKPLSGERRPLKFQEDYGQKLLEYDTAPNESVRLLDCFFNEIQSFMPNFLPEDCKEYMRIRGLIVTPCFQGLGIAKKLWRELLVLALNSKIEWVSATSMTPASINIGLKFGMKPMFTYKYGDFKCNGQAVFGNTLQDGTTELQLLVGNLEEMKPFFL